jgi:dTDP-4-dehydrorhamnose 3,5-epimerase
VIFSRTALQDAVLIDVERHGDERGHLARTFCEREFADHGLVRRFVQASTIFSPLRGTLRGLHFQRAPYGEVKLVRCTRGAARVTIVDLRPQSPTHRQWLGVECSPENGRLLYVPVGFAQGYQTLLDDTEVAYQMSHEYVPEAATGVRWDDPAFAIEWPATRPRIISERDRSWPDYETCPTPAPAAGRPVAGAAPPGR